MRRQTIIRAAASRDVCAFCLSRLEQARATAPSRRVFSSSSRLGDPAGQAVAERQDDDEAVSQQQTRFDQAPSFPDPEWQTLRPRLRIDERLRSARLPKEPFRPGQFAGREFPAGHTSRRLPNVGDYELSPEQSWNNLPRRADKSPRSGGGFAGTKRLDLGSGEFVSLRRTTFRGRNEQAGLQEPSWGDREDRAAFLANPTKANVDYREPERRAEPGKRRFGRAAELEQHRQRRPAEHASRPRWHRASQARSSEPAIDTRTPPPRATDLPARNQAIPNFRDQAIPSFRDQANPNIRDQVIPNFRDQEIPSRREAPPSRRTSRAERLSEKYELDGQEGGQEDAAARKAEKRKRKDQRTTKSRVQLPPIELPPFVSVANLASMLKVRTERFVKKLEELGFEDIANDHVLNFENASLVAMEYDYEPVLDTSETEDLKPRPPAEDPSLLPPRPPVVTIMGHVDHGKTTLLDYLRKSSVAATEHGGITQHIGAFSVPMPSGKVITFLDTPGHAAFLTMRQRGANVTDMVILVVAADDSVKPQTIEAIKHAKSAQVPIIVAINKVDKEEIDIERVKQDLTRHEIVVEDYGGDVQSIQVSGKTGFGLDELEEAMSTQAEILDMRAERDGPAEGWILEATTKKAGRVATVLVRRGTLRPGDVVVAGTTWAKVRTLKNEAGVDVAEAPPGTPVEVDGWRDQPSAGDEVLQAESEQKASSVASFRGERALRSRDAKDVDAINESRRLEVEKRAREKADKEAADAAVARGEDPREALGQAAESRAPKTPAITDLYVLIKADVSGSAEAVESSILSLPLASQPVTLSILRSGVGPISESDIDLMASVPSGNGIIVSFNQAVSPAMQQQAQAAGIRVLDASIIYKVIDEVRAAVEDRLPPVVRQSVVGEVECAAVFDISLGGRRTMKVAGCKVRNGVVAKGRKVKVYRGGVGADENVVYKGTVSTLKSHKKDVSEMRKGNECGMSFDGWEDFRVGDVFQCYDEHSEKRLLA